MSNLVSLLLDKSSSLSSKIRSLFKGSEFSFNENSSSKIAITLGDPCSIGAEITHKALANLDVDLSRIILIGNREMYGMVEEGVEFIDIPSSEPLVFGKQSVASGEVAFRSVEKAIEFAKKGTISSIVTAPISKHAINLAGHNFSGHTEIFDKYLADGKSAQMLFVTGDFRVLLLTRHIPLAKVPSVLTKYFIEKEIINLNLSLRKFGLKAPKIALCGLNPHAGEGGLLGEEEQKEFIPAISSLKNQGINVEGPFPADMLFAKAAEKYRHGDEQPYDCYVATYHDQGLCAVKSIDIENTINVTIGLDVLRTSPAHGTAFDIAGKNIAQSGSMEKAIIFSFSNIK
jgi:4-hydroxythreonine-4-phosphate dehydrogenase